MRPGSWCRPITSGLPGSWSQPRSSTRSSRSDCTIRAWTLAGAASSPPPAPSCCARDAGAALAPLAEVPGRSFRRGAGPQFRSYWHDRRPSRSAVVNNCETAARHLGGHLGERERLDVMGLREEIVREDRGDTISGSLEDGEVAGERARTAGEIRETRRGAAPARARGQPRRRDRSAAGSRTRAGRRHRPPTRRGSEAAAACSCRAGSLHPARCARRRAPLHPRARHRALVHPRRSTCAASRRDRNRDRARSYPRPREDALRRSARHPVADPAKAAGRPADHG